MISFNIEMPNSAKNSPLKTSFKKCGVAIDTFRNLLNMAVLEEHPNKTDIKTKGKTF